MSIYQTHQRKALIEYMVRHRDCPMSAPEIAQGLHEMSPSTQVSGVSTTYRLLTKLTEEGLVKRIATSHSRRFLYQIMQDERCHHHMHLQCAKCGRVEHMDDTTSALILDKVKGASDFLIDQEETVLFGFCKGCQAMNQREEKHES